MFVTEIQFLAAFFLEARIGFSSGAFSRHNNLLYVVPVVASQLLADASSDAFQDIHAKFFTAQLKVKEGSKKNMLEIKTLKS